MYHYKVKAGLIFGAALMFAVFRDEGSAGLLVGVVAAVVAITATS